MKPDWFQEIAARMAAEMRELDHEFASLKDYEAGIASRTGGTTMKHPRETLLAAAEWCDYEASRLVDEMNNSDTPLRERIRLNQKRISLFDAAALMREAAMEMDE